VGCLILCCLILFDILDLLLLDILDGDDGLFA
jgi:hypothetical protein